MQGLTGSPYADRDLRTPPDLTGLVRSAWRDALESEPIDDDTGFLRVRR
jgi:hypothetical protein